MRSLTPHTTYRLVDESQSTLFAPSDEFTDLPDDDGTKDLANLSLSRQACWYVTSYVYSWANTGLIILSNI
jgi:hypothetical protein